jgi:hypothetical protein
MAFASHKIINAEHTKSVIEVGNQTPRSFNLVSKLIPGVQPYNKVSDFYKQFGVELYDSIDLNSDHGSIIRDLNYEHEWPNKYELVTNYGTSEHIFNQKSVFANMHEACAVNGVIIHCLPVNYFDHGFYNYNPNLFFSIAKSNDYQVLFSYITHVNGGRKLHLPKDWLKQPHIKRRSFLQGFQLEGMIIFAARKTTDAKFKMPIQHVLYDTAVESDHMQKEYGAKSYLQLALERFDPSKHFFTDPFPHIVIENAISQEKVNEIVKRGSSGKKLKVFTGGFRTDYELKQPLDTQSYFKLCDIFNLSAFKQLPLVSGKVKNTPGVVCTSTVYSQYEQSKITLDDCKDFNSKNKVAASIPHRDLESKMIVCLLYLADAGDNLGGDFEMFDGLVRGDMKTHQQQLKDLNAKLKKTVKYAPGTLVVFLNSPRAVHCIGERKNGTHTRKMMLTVFETVNSKWTKQFYSGL